MGDELTSMAGITSLDQHLLTRIVALLPDDDK